MKKAIMAEWEATDLHLHVMMFSGSKYPESFDAAVPEELIYSDKLIDGCC
jgi:hypothetical protein